LIALNFLQALRKAAKEDGEPGTSTSHKKDDKEKKRKRGENPSN
jgi:heat shock protein HslJ